MLARLWEGGGRLTHKRESIKRKEQAHGGLFGMDKAALEGKEHSALLAAYEICRAGAEA